MEIFWWFFLWTLYVLLPLGPTILIYRLFPSTTVCLSGPLSNLTLNATGAFAAYIVTVLLGFWLVSDIVTTMRNREVTRWWVVGKVVLKDSEGNVLPPRVSNELLEGNLQVTTQPKHYHLDGPSRIAVATTLLPQEEIPEIIYSIPQFGQGMAVYDRKKDHWDWKKNTIDLFNTIEITAPSKNPIAVEPKADQ